uniref:AMP deaminase-like n=1 Tax=Rhizophora mucronata TaxID=61149 RepID=A0A2P2LH12_RHIMU
MNMKEVKTFLLLINPEKHCRLFGYANLEMLGASNGPSKDKPCWGTKTSIQNRLKRRPQHLRRNLILKNFISNLVSVRVANNDPL